MGFLRKIYLVKWFFTALFLFSTSIALGQFNERGEVDLNSLDRWEAEYDLGFERDKDGRLTKMGQEGLKILARHPNFQEISRYLNDKQQFRADAPIPYRGFLTPNSVTALVQGQDGTHIASAAGRPGTAGFGGRVQDMLKYFGVFKTAFFTNALTVTVKYQAQHFGVPVVNMKNPSKPSVAFKSYYPTDLWAVMHHEESPLVQWRDEWLDWILRNNRDSLKMILVLGGASRDAMAGFMKRKGAEIQTNVSREALEYLKVPEYGAVGAGGNKTFQVPHTIVDGKPVLLYDEFGEFDYKNQKDQNEAQGEMSKRIGELVSRKRLVFTEGGIDGSGVMDPAQFGYTLFDKSGQSLNMQVITLSDGSKLTHIVPVLQVPHPTMLSMQEMKQRGSAAKTIAKALKGLTGWVEKGWEIEAEEGLVNKFAQGKPYPYGRTPVPYSHYDFGTPENRMVDKSTATRLSVIKHNGEKVWVNAVVWGTRDKPSIDTDVFLAAHEGKPETEFDPRLWNNLRLLFKLGYIPHDIGPGQELAYLMKSEIEKVKDEIFKEKAGKSFRKDGIDALNVKVHKDVGDYGHYRGTFNAPRILIMADPDGYDDTMTSRALTGARGQYLQSLLKGLGVPEQYLVISTVPFGMDGATTNEWKEVLRLTHQYRLKLLKAYFLKNKNALPELIMADGINAKERMNSLLVEVAKDSQLKDIANRIKKIEVVNIKKSGLGNNSGIAEAVKDIRDRMDQNKLQGLDRPKINNKMSDIPREHLPLQSQYEPWQGTGGNRVVTGYKPNEKGFAFVRVVPKAFTDAKFEVLEPVAEGVTAMWKTIREWGLRMPGENVVKFVSRKAQGLIPEPPVILSRPRTERVEEARRARGENVESLLEFAARSGNRCAQILSQAM